MTDMERLAAVADRIRSPLALTDGVSRKAVVLRGFEKSADRIDQLQAELEGAFEALAAAIENGEREGLSLTGVLRLSKPMESAWATWQNDRTAIDRATQHVGAWS